MPELTITHIAIVAAALLLGIVLGWILRSSRSTREKKAISAGWQAQIDSQQSEHDRLAEQNKSLMEQIAQYQASNKDSKMRARELADSLKDAFERRDELQRQLKDIRGNLEVAVTQRDKLKTSAETASARGEATGKTLLDRDNRIEKLTIELSKWRDRVPPLVERYRQRDLEAQQLEIELQKANDQLAEIENVAKSDNTRIEPVDSNSLPDGLDASNEPHIETTTGIISGLDDQIQEASGDSTATGSPDKPAAKNDDQPAGDLDHDISSESADAVDDEAAELNSERDAAADDEGHVVSMDASAASNDEPNEIEATIDDTDFENAFAEIQDDTAGPTTDGETVSDDVISAEGTEDFPNLLTGDYATGIYSQDDLRKIKGVGPAIEKTLNDLGIFRYNQIAEMSEYDIDRVAQELKGFRSRIYREDWIGQAKTLQYEKSKT